MISAPNNKGTETTMSWYVLLKLIRRTNLHVKQASKNGVSEQCPVRLQRYKSDQSSAYMKCCGYFFRIAFLCKPHGFFGLCLYNFYAVFTCQTVFPVAFNKIITSNLPTHKININQIQKA